MTPSDGGFQDRYIVSIDTKGKKGFKEYYFALVVPIILCYLGSGYLCGRLLKSYSSLPIKKEGLQLPSSFAARIAEKSNRNLRLAVSNTRDNVELEHTPLDALIALLSAADYTTSAFSV
ncbi:hypothetical protein P8452_53666 [Trifolium repens]|nr:hypothetical protein P8452_53666 [Trifolium repens]